MNRPPVLDPETMTDDERKKLAYDTLDYIKAHPEDWNQETWRCSTGMCYAGWLATLAGGTWLYPDPDNDEDYGEGSLVPLAGEDPDPVTAAVYDDSPNVHVSSRAGLLLGLSRTDALRLFDGDNKLEDIEALLSLFFGVRP